MRKLNYPARMGCPHAKESEQEPGRALGSHLLRGSLSSATPDEPPSVLVPIPVPIRASCSHFHTGISSIRKIKMQINPLTRLQGPKQPTASTSLTSPCPRRL